jgi:hypothetical protein
MIKIRELNEEIQNITTTLPRNVEHKSQIYTMQNPGGMENVTAV